MLCPCLASALCLKTGFGGYEGYIGKLKTPVGKDQLKTMQVIVIIAMTYAKSGPGTLGHLLNSIASLSMSMSMSRLGMHRHKYPAKQTSTITIIISHDDFRNVIRFESQSHRKPIVSQRIQRSTLVDNAVRIEELQMNNGGQHCGADHDPAAFAAFTFELTKMLKIEFPDRPRLAHRMMIVGQD